MSVNSSQEGKLESFPRITRSVFKLELSNCRTYYCF